MRALFLFLVLAIAIEATAQKDTAFLESLYVRGMNFNESKTDSIRVCAEMLFNTSKKIHFERGILYSLRLYGFYFESKGDYEKAVDYYLQTISASRTQKKPDFEEAALTDLAAVYTSNLNQPQKAKEVYLQCVEIEKQKNDVRSLVALYTNLGAIYNRMGAYDSSLFFLNRGLEIGKPQEEKGLDDLSALYNNLGNAYFLKKDFDQALTYFNKNLGNHLLNGDIENLWLDDLNLADSYIEKSMLDSAYKFADASLKIANQLQSNSKKADAYSILSKYYQKKGDYKKAFDYLKNWYTLDTALVNGETYKSIAELQEKFNARERENEKLLLQAEVQQQRFRNRIVFIAAIALFVVVVLIATALIIKRRANAKLHVTNELVTRQNEKLAELNYEKNSLISIVSHDLGAPFASIGMWSQILDTERETLTGEQQKAIEKIKSSTEYGEKLIRNILDIEKAETNRQKINLEQIDIPNFCQNIIENFQPAAAKKKVMLQLEKFPGELQIISDAQLLKRIFENLLSNAIKFTAPAKKVMMFIREEKDGIAIIIQDEGIGIEPDELPFLFRKYSKISTRATNGEVSTGLGLSIVKRLVEELDGSIRCESEPGKGSTFTVMLKM